MADKNIKKEVKKMKKVGGSSAVSSAVRPIAVQPELIKKKKKPM